MPGPAVTQAGMMLVKLNWPGILVFQEVFCVKGGPGCTMRTWIGDTYQEK